MFGNNQIITAHLSLLPFHDGGRYHIETSPLICGANQWTGFYMITAFVMKGLTLMTMNEKLIMIDLTNFPAAF